MNCPKCGKILDEGAVICSNCGETVVENITEENVKKSVVSEEVLRNFSDPEHIEETKRPAVYSENRNSDLDDDEYFNVNDQEDIKMFEETFAPFDSEDTDDNTDNSGDAPEEYYGNEHYQRGSVEDYDVFNDHDGSNSTYDNDDDDDDSYDEIVQPNKKGSGKTKIVLIAIIILSSLVLVCGVVYLLFGDKIETFFSDESKSPSVSDSSEEESSEPFEFAIPDLSGLKYADAVTKAKEYGLETKIVYQNSDTVEKGLVIEQSIDAGTMGKVGDVIILTVSLGKDAESTTDATEETTESTESNSENNQSSTEPSETPEIPTQPTEEPIEEPTDKPVQPTEPPTEPTTPPVNNYYILPDSSARLLTLDDISGLSLAELELARNEIYARHGRRFVTDYIQEYFNSQQWYSGTIDPDDFDYGVLSDIEVANVWFIYDYEHLN